MKLKLVLVLLAGLVLAAPPRAHGQDFHTLVARVGAALGVRPEHAGLLAAVSFFARLGHPHEARGLHIAMFEGGGAGSLKAAATALGPSWQRMVKTRNMRDGEQSLIFVRRQGKDFKMLILHRDADGEVQLVAIKVRPGDLINEIDRHGK